MGTALGLSYNCSLTMCGPLGFSVCNIWPSHRHHYGNQRPRTTCNAHTLGQPLIIIALILALQNLANVSRSNYIYTPQHTHTHMLTLVLLILSQSSEFKSPLFIPMPIWRTHNE